MDMAKYVAVGVLAVIVLAAVTYEAPPDPTSASSQTVTGTIGGEVPNETAGTVTPTVERGGEGTTLPASSPAHVATATVTTPPPAPPRDELLSYTVKAGQTLSDVAGELLGSRGRWKELYEFNKDKIPDPNRVRAGITVVFPGARRQQETRHETASAPISAPGGEAPCGNAPPAEGRTYVVKQGDTLYAIARRELGQAGRWKEIAQLNGIDGNGLIAGKRIKLPR